MTLLGAVIMPLLVLIGMAASFMAGYLFRSVVQVMIELRRRVARLEDETLRSAQGKRHTHVMAAWIEDVLAKFGHAAMDQEIELLKVEQSLERQAEIYQMFQDGMQELRKMRASPRRKE